MRVEAVRREGGFFIPIKSGLTFSAGQRLFSENLPAKRRVPVSQKIGRKDSDHIL